MLELGERIVFSHGMGIITTQALHNNTHAVLSLPPSQQIQNSIQLETHRLRSHLSIIPVASIIESIGIFRRPSTPERCP